MEKEKPCVEAGRVDFEHLNWSENRELLQILNAYIPGAYKYFLYRFMLNAEATPENLKLLNGSIEMLKGIKAASLVC